MWIYKLLRNKTRKTIVVFLVFVLPITVIFLPYVIQRFSYLKTYTLETWISLALAGSWAFLGPYFIFRYFESIKTFQNTIITLSDSSNDVTTDHHDSVSETVTQIIKEEMKAFSTAHKIICFIWIPIVIGILIVFNERLQDFAFWGFSDPYYWIAIVYISFLLYLQSLGFSGLLSTYRLIRRITALDYMIEDVLEGSFQDGIKIFGTLLIKTTLYFFSGIVFFPILIVFAKQQSAALTLSIIIVMFIFSISVLVFFLYTYWLIYQSAEKRKNALIEEFQAIYNREMKESLSTPEPVNASYHFILNELKISNVYRHIEKLEKINTNPIHLSKVVVTVFTVIFPALFFIQDFLELIAYFFPAT